MGNSNTGRNGDKNKITLGESVKLFRRGVSLIVKYCPGLFLTRFLHAAVTAVTPYVTVFFSARVIDELTGARRPEYLWRLAAAAVVFAGALTFATTYLNRRKDLSWRVFWHWHERIFTNKLLSMDYADLDNQSTNDLYAQIKQNASNNSLGLTMVVLIFDDTVKSIIGIASAVTLTAGLFLSRVPENAGNLTILDKPSGLFIFFLAVAVPIMIAPLLSGKIRSYQNSVAMADLSREANRAYVAFGYLADKQYRAPDIRMYNQQVIARHYMEHDAIYGTDGPFGKLDAGLGGLLRSAAACMSAVLTGVVYLYVCLKAWAGAFGIGSVTQYIAAVTAFTGSVTSLLGALTSVRNNALYLQLAFQFLDMPNAMYQGSLTTEKRSDRQYDVEFRDVSFKYPGSDNWALRHVSVKFQVGRRLAVVGENGSGKTTFIKLLCRLYDPQEGQILLNGIDICKYNYQDYMGVFSVVFQDFQLLSQPLGNNVAGCLNYDKKRVLKSLTDAGFSDRLAELPKGLDTQLYKDFDDEGVTISGGEAQKIAIARALYKDAPFIILDEPTAALDPITEAEIYARFNEISGDKTAVYISHRLSSCRFCDEILVFDGGQIIQQGSHEGLLADEGGQYYRLWHAQAQYYNK